MLGNASAGVATRPVCLNFHLVRAHVRCKGGVGTIYYVYYIKRVYNPHAEYLRIINVKQYKYITIGIDALGIYCQIYLFVCRTHAENANLIVFN